MPNYLNQIPENPASQMTNTLLGAIQLKQGEKRNELAERRLTLEEQEAKLRNMALPMSFIQMKSRHVGEIARRIEALPTEQRSAKYAQLYNKVLPAPIANHQELGPLGTIDPTDYLSPEEFNSLPEEKQREYLNELSYTSDEFAKIDLKRLEGLQQSEKLYQQALNKKEEILYDKRAKSELQSQKQKDAMALEQEKGRQARLTEQEKAKTGTGADKTQTRIDKYRSDIVDMEKEILKVKQGTTDKLDLLISVLGKTGGSVPEGASKDDKQKVIDAAQEHINWMRKQLRKLEGMGADDDPLKLRGGK